MKNRFDTWIRLKEKVIENHFSIEFYDMHDAKFLYMMLQCLPWSQKYHPFCRCKYKRDKAFEKGFCTKLSNEE